MVVALPVSIRVSISDSSVLNTQGRVHLVVEDLRFTARSGLDQMLIENLEDIHADLGQLLLDLLTVFLDESDLRLIALRLLLLLDGGDDSPRGTTRADDVLVGDGKEVALFDGQLLICCGNVLHLINHFCITVLAKPRSLIPRVMRTFIALGLLSQLGQVNVVFVRHLGLGGGCKEDTR